MTSVVTRSADERKVGVCCCCCAAGVCAGRACAEMDTSPTQSAQKAMASAKAPATKNLAVFRMGRIIRYLPNETRDWLRSRRFCLQGSHQDHAGRRRTHRE